MTVGVPPRGERLAPPGPRLRALLPPGTAACRACGRRIAQARFEAALRVCPACGHHAPLPARMRVEHLVDAGTARPLDIPAVDHDPLGFDDGVPYLHRLASAREATGGTDAVLVARGAVEGSPAVVAAMDFAFLGGSLGAAAGEIITTACDVAVEERRGLVLVCVSGGARMQEGIVALAQMGRCTAALAGVAAARLPCISILGDPCFGGVTASFATQADVILAEPGARIGFAGGRVIEQATHQRLPEGFQTAEFLLSHGMVDAVVPRAMLRHTTGVLLRTLGAGSPS